MSNYYKWCMELKENWKTKNVKQIMQQFDENIEYYETPIMKVNGIKEIESMWEEIKEQNTRDVEFNIICQDDECCIANFILKDKISYDMIYQIKLNEYGKCTFLKQWYMEV